MESSHIRSVSPFGDLLQDMEEIDHSIIKYQFGNDGVSEGDIEGEVDADTDQDVNLEEDDMLFDDVEPISDILLYIDYDLEANSSTTHKASIQDIEKLYEECASKSMELYIVTERGMEDELLNRIYEHSSKLTEIYNQTQIGFIKTDEAHDIVMKRALGIFYFSQRKNEYLSKNFSKLLEYNKFVLHKKFDSYTALLDVLSVRRSLNHPYENDGFIEYYKNLDGESTLPESNAAFDAFYQERIQKKATGVPVPAPAPVPAPVPVPVPVPSEATFVTSEVPAQAEAEAEEEPKRVIQIKKAKGTIFRTTEYKILNVLYTTYIDIQYMKEVDPTAKIDIMVNNAQKFALMHNCRNPAIDIIYIYHCDAEEDLMKDFMANLTEEECKKIRFLENSYQDVFMIKDVMNHANQHHANDIIFIIRSDCFIDFTASSISKIVVSLTMETSNKKAYVISRSERLMNGHIFKDPRYASNYYAISQDLYIFQAPLQLAEIEAEEKKAAEGEEAKEETGEIVYSDIDFYEGHHELIFNKVLETNGYRLYNDTESIRVIRVMTTNDMRPTSLDKREIVKIASHKMCKHTNYYYLPENAGLNSMSVQEMFEKFYMSEDEIYQAKRYIYLNFCK